MVGSAAGTSTAEGVLRATAASAGSAAGTCVVSAEGKDVGWQPIPAPVIEWDDIAPPVSVWGSVTPPVSTWNNIAPPATSWDDIPPPTTTWQKAA
jgi:hypothetical protein